MGLFKGSHKRFELLSKIGLIVISIVLAGFLIALSSNFMSDLDKIYTPPRLEDFKDQSALTKIENEILPYNMKIKDLNEQKQLIYNSINTINRNYNSEKQSYKDFLSARKVIGSPDEDPGVRERLKKLEDIRSTLKIWNEKLDAIQLNIKNTNIKINKLSEMKKDLQKKFQAMHQYATKSHQINIFLIRLAIFLPILLIAIFLLYKWRHNKFKAFIWGYTIAAFYAFFVGLVPYLPNFGGYIRYIVGIIITILFGIYVTKLLSAYTARKKAELEQTQEKRIKNIKHEIALKAYKTHSCPSCEQDFILLKWIPKSNEAQKDPKELETLSYCQHCGLKLFEKCGQCSHYNYIYFPFCGQCGKTLENNA